MRHIKLNIVAALAESDRGIGFQNRVPWKIKKDLQHLKNLTRDQIVILGRKSYDSMAWYYKQSGRPMPGKLYVIITRNKDYKPIFANTLIVGSIDEALQSVKNYDISDAYVIGGAEIFKSSLPYVDRLYLTIVKGSFSADTYFPQYDDFQEVETSEWKEENGVQFRFAIFEKKTDAKA